ncbi:XRE family transcriptional regulator [Microbacterium sp. LRZ72]|uniref:helix-turn-helix domain-containing protein n=1 Tax=Microbacterium sp. LRZ72 TaxID=2942481 RepID=UPI0029B76157|nr:helix-turn-helix domain-containing protein [Microbacterium sp. LRZ72]MDX2375217.1 XRE family transcriptional regulator [Microbacterium sp. LRZ72]
MASELGEQLRGRRERSGMSQRALAQAAGIPQPNIAAYEVGRRVPSATTLARLDAALDVPTLADVRDARDALLAAATARRLSNVRVFGSVARGEAGSGSDVDLLVHPAIDASLFDLAAFMDEARDILGVAVDVVSDRAAGAVTDAIARDAVPL